MSRALGAAFLNHQVEQLEKTVTGTGSGNWRDRRQTQGNGPPPNNAIRRGPNPPGVKVVPRRKQDPTPMTTTRDKVQAEPPRTISVSPTARRRSEEETKDGDIVVVDASVLVHALYKVKKWCRDGRQEVVIVPLEGVPSVP